MRNAIFSLAILVLLLLLVGCSKAMESPITSDESLIPATSTGNSSVEVIQSGTFVIDPDTWTISSVDRTSDSVFNITGFLGKKCPGGCFRFRIVGIVGTVLEIELTLENPYALQPYDCRVVYINTYGKEILNPDSYTNFGRVPTVNVYPFTAFMKEDDSRAFPIGPGGIDTETLFLDFPPGALAAVDYAITASFPGQTLDPYEISDMNQQGELYPSGGSATFSCRVLDHQNDVSTVDLNASPLTGGWVSMTQSITDPEVWSVQISNTQSAPIGSYILLIKAYSQNNQNIYTFNFVEAVVTEEIISGDLVAFSNGNIYTCKPDHTEITNLGHPGSYPCISQNNNIIVYIYSGDLRAMDVDGSNDRLILDGNFLYPSVTADGQTIAFYDNVSPSNCYRIDSDGTDLVTINPSDGVAWRYANISGDGSKIVLQRSPYEIYVCDGDGSNLALVKADGGYPLITNNGNWIFYEVAFQIRRIHPDGTGDENVIGQSATSRYGMTPDGTKVTYCQYYSGNGNDLGVYDLVTHTEIRLTFTNKNAWMKTLSTDGKWVVSENWIGPIYSIKSDGTGPVIEWGAGSNPSCNGSVAEHF
jgi:hypothetical protein